MVVVGVPLNTAPVRVRPGGNVPAVWAKVYPDPEPPDAVNVTEYEVPTVPFGRGEALVIIGPPQELASEAELRGLGAPTVKSAPLLSVSAQPLLFLSAAVVLAVLPVGTPPSEQVAVDP